MSGGDPREALLLDEMFAPTIAETLRTEGFDVLAVAGHPVLGASPDPDVARWAVREDRRLLTENVRDFAALVTTTESTLRVLFTSSRRFPRARRNPGSLLGALRAWLVDDVDRTTVEWLV